MSTVAEMKKRLPSDKRSRSKASTVEALHYALNCVKQVQGDVSSVGHRNLSASHTHFPWLSLTPLVFLCGSFPCSQQRVLQSADAERAGREERCQRLHPGGVGAGHFGAHAEKHGTLTAQSQWAAYSRSCLFIIIFFLWIWYQMQLHKHVYLTAGECVCVYCFVVSVTGLARVPVCLLFFPRLRLSVRRTPSWWSSRCRAAAWCMRRNRLPASSAARGSSWSRPSSWSSSSTRTSTCFTRTQLSCTCHHGATRTPVGLKLLLNVFFFFFHFKHKVSHWVYVFYKNTFILYMFNQTVVKWFVLWTWP